MTCKACGYDSDKNTSDQDYEFWKMSEVQFEFERQEFTDEKEIMKGQLYCCPKCFTLRIEDRIIDTVSTED